MPQPNNPFTTAFPSGDDDTLGLTKREYFTAAALQGLLTHSFTLRELDNMEPLRQSIAELAVAMADVTLEELT